MEDKRSKRQDGVRKPTTVRFSPQLRQELESCASARSTSLTTVINLACERFLADEGLQSELRDMEARIAATVSRSLTETARVEDDVQLVIAQVDQLIRFMFQVTPEILDRRAAGIIGARRYTDFLADFPKQFRGRKRRASFVSKIEEQSEDDDDASLGR